MCSETGLVLREDSTESVDLHQESDKVSVRKKHLGLARWEMEEFCKQREEPECRLWGTKIFSEQKAASVTGTQWTKRGDAR